MPTKSSGGLTREAAIKSVAATLEAPLPLDTFVEQVLQLHVSHAQSAKANIRTEIRNRSSHLDLIFTDRQRSVITPLRLAVAGLRFRQVITSANVSARLVLLDQAEDAFLPRQYTVDPAGVAQIRLEDAAGHRQPFQVKRVQPTVQPAYQFMVPMRFGLHMPAWLREHKVVVGDSILFTVLQYDPPIWRIEHEPHAAFDAAAAAQRDAELIDILYEMLETARKEHLWVNESIIAAYQQVADRAGYPGSPWPAALAADGRMRDNGYDLTYSDSRLSPLADLLLPTSTRRISEHALSSAQTGQIYRLKVEATYRKRFWREVEIQGGQTWADLNSALVDTFVHDPDHLGGFWRLIRRGGGKKFRETELAQVDPFGDGDNADSPIAEAGLELGDLLKWVFDFGDWYEYRLTLVDIIPAEQALPTAEYPRVVAQNAPAYKHCTECLARGREVVAHFVCNNCSTETQALYMLCKRCAEKHNENHYVEKYVY